MFYQQPYNQINEYTKKLKPLIGSTVQCNFGGPEKGEGILLKVGLDYCVLQCDKEVYYYPLHHIKGYRLIQEDDDSEQNSDTEENGNDNNKNKNSECPVIVPGRRFVDVIDRLKGQKVQFNKGPSKIKGIIVGRDADYIMLGVNDEVLYVPAFHIQNMCCNNQQDQDDSKDDKNNDNNKNSSQNSNESNGKNSNGDSNKNSDKNSSKNGNENSSKDSNKNSNKNSSKNGNKNSNENNSKNGNKTSNENSSKTSNKNNNKNGSSSSKESNKIEETVVGRDEDEAILEVNNERLYASTTQKQTVHWLDDYYNPNKQTVYWWDHYYNTNNNK